MSIKLSIFKNTGAGVLSKVSAALLRLIQVPILISALGVEDFGRWLVLSSLPVWLMLANMGFGSVASNEMSMAVAANDLKLARKMFSTTLALVGGIGVIGTVIALTLFPFVPWEHLLNVAKSRHDEMVVAVIWLALSVFISFSIEAFSGRFRAARKAHMAVLISSLSPWLDLAGLVLILQFSKRFDHLAMAVLFSTIVLYVVNWWFSYRAMPALSFSAKEVDTSRFKYLFKKGIAFQAFPLGTALLFQGNLLIVQTFIGPVGVAIFSTARTLVRTVNQFMELINQALWPELSHLFGMQDFNRITKLHRSAVGISVAVSTLATIFFIIFGQAIYSFWVGKSIDLPQHLLLLFLLQVPFTAFWYTSSVIHIAGNQHEGLAVRNLIAAGLAVVSCAVLSYYIGLEGAAISTLVFDLVLIPYVLKRSLYLTHDSLPEFFTGIFKTAKFGYQHWRRLIKI